MCACRLTENEHKKRQKVQKKKDEIGEKKRITENGKRVGAERIGPKITEKMENDGKSVSLFRKLEPVSVAVNTAQVRAADPLDVFSLTSICFSA